MKAQSLRKTLWLSSGLLTLAVLAGAAFYFTSAQSAAAASPSDAWIKKSWDAYQQEKQVAKPDTYWPVGDVELKAHLTRPDIVEPESRIGVWPYVGPVPPPAREPPKDGPKIDEPTGLAAIGNPSFVILRPPPQTSMVKWVFTASKKAGFFEDGDYFTEKREKDAKGRFKLISVDRPDPFVAKYRIHYEVYEEGKSEPILKDQMAEFSLWKPESVTSMLGIVNPPAAKETAPGKPATNGATPETPSVSQGVPPPVAEVKIAVRNSGDNAREIEFDDAAYRYFFYSNPDSLAAEVKTEEIKEGIRISGISTGSVANQFGVQQGDIIKSINGVPVHNRSQAIEVVKGLPKNIERVTVVIQRNARDLVYSIDPRDPKIRAEANRARFDNQKK